MEKKNKGEQGKEIKGTGAVGSGPGQSVGDWG